MSETANYTNNSQTVVVDAESFTFETIERENGNATVIRFKVDNPDVRAGDVLLVLSGSDIHFHGMIGMIENAWAIATDRRGSLLPATIQ
jgi:cell shape-determining protein MreC